MSEQVIIDAQNNLPKLREKYGDDAYRLKALRVPIRTLLSFLYFQEGPPQYVEFPRIGVLPKGFVVVGAYADPMTLCFRVVLHHPDFPLLPEGKMLECADAEVLWEAYALASKEELNERNRKYDEHASTLLAVDPEAWVHRPQEDIADPIIVRKEE